MDQTQLSPRYRTRFTCKFSGHRLQAIDYHGIPQEEVAVGKSQLSPRNGTILEHFEILNKMMDV